MYEFYAFFIFMCMAHYFSLKKDCDKKEITIYWVFNSITAFFAFAYFKSSMNVNSFTESILVFFNIKG